MITLDEKNIDAISKSFATLLIKLDVARRAARFWFVIAWISIAFNIWGYAK